MKVDRSQVYDDENLARKESLRKNSRRESLLFLMNRALAESHRKLEDTKVSFDYPIIFVFGLPRSATTLMLQAFTMYFDVGYINNLIARFWSAPLYGISLSQEILDSKKQCFESVYGKTPELEGPHEFSYFWHEWFNVSSMQGIDVEFIRRSTDWNGLSRRLLNMAALFSRPLVLKGMWPGYVASDIQRMLPKTYFIYMRRNPIDIAVSLYRARMDYYGNPDTWWSLYPPEYEQLLGLDWPEQIAGQLYYLNRCYEGQLVQLSPMSYSHVEYKELCTKPREVMAELRGNIEAYTGYELDLSGDIPERFSVRHPGRDFKNSEKLLEAVRYYFEEETIDT